MPLTDDILEILKDQLQKTNDNIAVLEKKKFEIQEGIQKYILQAKLYETDFVPYKGQWLDEITLIIEDNGISYINISASKIEDRKEMYQKLGFSLSYYDVNKLNVLYDGKKNKKDYRCYGIMTKKDFFDKINNKEDNAEKHDRVINSNSGYVYNLFLLFGSIMFLCYLCVQGAIYLVK